MVLDNFIHKSVSSGLGSPQVEIMADTAVALASANVQLVAKKVIGRLCRVMDKTCLSPTQYLEQHVSTNWLLNKHSLHRNLQCFRT